MKRILFLIAALFTLDVLAFGQGVPPLKVSTVDGTVKSNNIGKIVVTNGTLSISGTTATITISGGGGGSPGGSNTQVQYNNVGAFGGAAGFTFNGTSTITLGVAGTSVGAIAFKNATSGTVTLQPVTGALGTVTLSLPATTGTLTALGNTTTGSGSIVLATSPTLVTPALGTPSSATLTNATGLPVSTGISGLGTGVATALANAVNGASGIVVTGSSNQISETLSANNVTGLLIKRNTDTSPTGNYFDFQNAAGATVAKLDIAGALTVTSCTGCGGSSGITVGTTTITSGTNTKVLFNNAGVVGEYTITGTGNVAMSASPTFTGTVNAANAVLTTAVTTGTGATAGLNVTANSLTTGNGVDISSTSATSGNLVSIASTSTAAASSTLTGLKIAMSGANANTARTVTGASISVTNTNATSGTNVALTLTASGATTANTALNVTAGQSLFASGTAAAPGIAWGSETNTGIYRAASGYIYFTVAGTAVGGFGAGQFDVIPSSTGGMRLYESTGTNFSIIRNAGTSGSTRFGAADAAAPVAQTLSVQNVVAGTSNTAGANFTIDNSIGTGTGAGGDFIVRTAPAGGSGTAQNSLAAAFTVKGNGAVLLKSVTFANLPTVANGYLIYCSDCTLASPCASGGTGALAKGINGAWVCN